NYYDYFNSRLAQSIIEVTRSQTVKTDKLDVYALKINETRCFEEAMLVEMLHQYIQLDITTEADVIKRRNICMLVANLNTKIFNEFHVKFFDPFGSIRLDLHSYLTRTLT